MKKVKIITSLTALAVTGTTVGVLASCSCGQKLDENVIPFNLLKIQGTHLLGLNDGVDISKYTTLEVPSSVDRIVSGAFRDKFAAGSTVTTIKFHKEIRLVQQNSFAGCKGITKFDLSDIDDANARQIEWQYNIFGEDKDTIPARVELVFGKNISADNIQYIKDKLLAAGLPEASIVEKTTGKVEAVAETKQAETNSFNVNEFTLTVSEETPSYEFVATADRDGGTPGVGVRLGDVNVTEITNANSKKYKASVKAEIVNAKNDGDYVTYKVDMIAKNSAGKVLWVETIENFKLVYNKLKEPQVRLTSIAISPKSTHQTEFEKNSEFNRTGLKLDATFSDFTKELVTTGFTTDMDGQKVTKDTTTVTVTYNGFKTSYKITGVDPTPAITISDFGVDEQTIKQIGGKIDTSTITPITPKSPNIIFNFDTTEFGGTNYGHFYVYKEGESTTILGETQPAEYEKKDTPYTVTLKVTTWTGLATGDKLIIGFKEDQEEIATIDGSHNVDINDSSTWSFSATTPGGASSFTWDVTEGSDLCTINGSGNLTLTTKGQTQGGSATIKATPATGKAGTFDIEIATFNKLLIDDGAGKAGLVNNSAKQIDDTIEGAVVLPSKYFDDREEGSNTWIPTEKINSGAFTAKGIYSIYISKSIKTITAGTTTSVFGVGLTKIDVDSNNQTFSSPKGSNCIMKSSTELYKGCAGSIIPDGVATISSSAFNTTGITNIVIPSSVEKIGNYAFARCTKLSSITIPSSVTSIGSNCFWNCGSTLTDVTIQSTKPWIQSTDTTAKAMLNISSSSTNAINLKETAKDVSNNWGYTGINVDETAVKTAKVEWDHSVTDIVNISSKTETLKKESGSKISFTGLCTQKYTKNMVIKNNKEETVALKTIQLDDSLTGGEIDITDTEWALISPQDTLTVYLEDVEIKSVNLTPDKESFEEQLIPLTDYTGQTITNDPAGATTASWPLESATTTEQRFTFTFYTAEAVPITKTVILSQGATTFKVTFTDLEWTLINNGDNITIKPEYILKKCKLTYDESVTKYFTEPEFGAKEIVEPNVGGSTQVSFNSRLFSPRTFDTIKGTFHLVPSNHHNIKIVSTDEATFTDAFKGHSWTFGSGSWANIEYGEDLTLIFEERAFSADYNVDASENPVYSQDLNISNNEHITFNITQNSSSSTNIIRYVRLQILDQIEGYQYRGITPLAETLTITSSIASKTPQCYIQDDESSWGANIILFNDDETQPYELSEGEILTISFTIYDYALDQLQEWYGITEVTVGFKAALEGH